MTASQPPEEDALRVLAAGMREMEPVFEDAICDGMRHRPSYSGLDADQVRPAVRRHILTFIDHFAEGARTMSDADQQFFRSMGEQRAQQGVTIDDLVYIWRLLINQMRDYVQARSAQHGAAAILAALQTIDQLDTGLLEMVAGYQTVETGRRPGWLRNVDSRAVRAITDPGRSMTEVQGTLMVHGFSEDARLYVSRTRPSGDEDRTRAVRWAAEAAGPTMCGLIDGDVCLISGEPVGRIRERAIGTAGPVDATGLPDAMRTAQRALEVALHLGHRGPRTLTDLGVMPAVIADADVGAALLRRYVDTVHERTASGETILETVEEFLRQDLKLAPTAKQLHLHLNTVRYRVAKFEEIVGVNIRHVDHLVEIWWALKRRHVR